MLCVAVSARTAPALVAASLAFASAAVSLYWLLGGTGLLDTVGGEIEELARERSAAALAGLGATVLAKAAAGALALALLRPRRRLAGAAGVGGVLLALYGGVLVLVGALVLAGAIAPSEPVDRHALRWHVFVWDLWFVVWGVALAVAAQRART
jgi:Protein of unknown function (DUF3995)